MRDLKEIAADMRAHYEEVWRTGNAWDFESSEFEQGRYAYLLKKIADRRYGRVLEIGCGSGCFTRLLAGVADRVVAMDIAAAAIERARIAAPSPLPLSPQGERGRGEGAGPGTVEFRVANIIEYDPADDEPWDLVVLSETIYSLGWLYPFFNLAFFAAQLFVATSPGGRCLLANTYGRQEDWLLEPSLIHTYRDLLRNVGYRLESEEVYRGIKDEVAMEVLVSLFQKPVQEHKPEA